MRSIFIALALCATLVATSCSEPDTVEAKQKELADLRSQQEKLSRQITSLEKELADEGVKTDAGTETKGVPVNVMSLASDTFQHYVEVQGKVDSRGNISIQPKVPGVVTDIYVQRGDKVTKGKVLAQLDGALVQRQMDELRTRLDLAKDLYERQSRLREQNIGTEVQFLQTKNQKESLERSMRTLQEQMANYRIVAPSSGTIDNVVPSVGEAVSPGMPIIQIVNFTDAHVEAEIPEAYANSIKKGQLVEIYLPDIDKQVKSKVAIVSQSINPASRSFTVEFAITEKDIQLRPNMLATVKINDYTNADIISVPINVVQRDDKGNYIYVVENSESQMIAKKKYVKTGKSYGAKVEITEGLNADDRIVTTGYQNIVEGQVLKIQNNSTSMR